MNQLKQLDEGPVVPSPFVRPKKIM